MKVFETGDAALVPLVESLLDPNPSPYVRSLSPDRFTEVKWNWDDACVQAAHVYETYYGGTC